MSNLTKYNLDCETRSSFEFGQLVPFLCQEVVPGDKYRVNSSTLVRLQPMLAPLMHRLDYYQRFYYVPYRLLCPNYEDLLTEPDGPYKVPDLLDYCPVNNDVKVKDYTKQYPLLEYFGLKSEFEDANAGEVFKDLNAFPLLAYYLIYNYYYMRSDLDPDYIDTFRPDKFLTSNIRPHLGKVKYVNEAYDYFTSAKIETQYGDMVKISDYNKDGHLQVPELQLAERLQSFKERLLRVGGKYVNYIKEFFDVAPLDARVMQPKYLGGDSYVLNVSDVDQTSPAPDSSVGTSYGKSVSVSQSGNVQYDVFEHGLIIGLHFVRPRVSNIGGCPRMFLRKTYFDFFNPHFSSLGFQELENRELDPSRSGTFGYVPRYDELRFGNDIVSGDFRRSLEYWHLSRDISEETLSKEFLTSYSDNRIFAYQELDSSLGSYGGNFIVLGLKSTTNSSSSHYGTLEVLVFDDGNVLFKKDTHVDITLNYVDDRLSDTYNIVSATQPSVYGFSVVHTQDFTSSFSCCFTRPADVPGIIRNKPFHKYIRLKQGQRPYFKFVLHTAYNRLTSRNDTTILLSDIFTLTYKSKPYTCILIGKYSSDYPNYITLQHPISECFIGYDDQAFINNHILSVTYNNVDVLRPLPNYKYNVLS